MYFGQYIGPFSANEEIIKETGIIRLAISGKVGEVFTLNGKEFHLGKTGMYEIDSVEITSLKFNQDVDGTHFVTYSIKLL